MMYINHEMQKKLGKFGLVLFLTCFVLRTMNDPPIYKANISHARTAMKAVSRKVYST